MNPDDMTEAGLAPGDRVEIASRHGALRGSVQPDKGVGRGTVSMAHCWGDTDPTLDPEQRQGSFTGRLVSLDQDIEPINHMPWQTGIAVSVHKAQG
jgi:anaerobic selenocysteine-containing dehydrogenase